MTTWWYCPTCGKVTDEFESEELDECPKCKEKNDCN
tara:strand:- start:2238 stop:2345 length:108 start_codon:yes stop_codon:yes gene_type:complete